LATTFSTVKPNFLNTSLNVPDAPKVSTKMPSPFATT
jgi:hypothetical protein